MGKLRTATILAAGAAIAAFVGNYTPLASPIQSSDSSVSQFVAQMLGDTYSIAAPTNSCWKMDNKKGCANDLAETNSVQIDASKCSHSGKGTLRVSLVTGVPVRCGKPLALQNLTLQTEFVDGERKPASENANLPNFDNAPILIPSGTSVHYNNDKVVSQITLAEQLNEQTIFGSAHVDQKSGLAHIKKANLTVYQNVLHLIGKSEIKDLVLDDSCCTPVAGTIRTHFEAGQSVAPTTDGVPFIGKTETLTFDGCGSAQLRTVDGHRSQIPIKCL
jgi:hypothetical protein